MTIQDIKDLLVTADPNVRHYFSEETDGDYTVWFETQRLPAMADGYHVETGWHFFVHRFTRNEDDAIAELLWQVLDGDDRVSVSEQVSFDYNARYIHYIFECDGL